ncbi:formylglycine-generating enzyme family protein [Luteimonas sp. 50]|uniref:Formylglycine-generating enzyme family protein n=1 Tax=Cognatiluteimonas sedimenti TaxID=2927791 RepID=A0ABT0A0B9_9GAMM|nr:formylglycine-generating enzyme family protein [Lysobacter sedimenti]MCJ0824426.1 formylglycine-generating enzyme family protein [Lysobacter sedimenti]
MRVGKPATAAAAIALALVLAGCGRKEADTTARAAAGLANEAPGQVSVEGDDRIAASLTWQAPEVVLAADDLPDAHRRAAKALAEGRLYADGEAAIPLYLAILKQVPDDAAAKAGLQRALEALLATGDQALAAADDDLDALRQAHAVASVARAIAVRDEAVQAFLGRVDEADRLWELNRQAERDLRAGKLGESGSGALPRLRAALRIRPGQARALQGLAAVESGLIRRGEEAGARGDFDNAERWIALAATVRPGSDTIADARARIAGMRRARIAGLRDQGMMALLQRDGDKDIALARGKLAEILRIAEPGDAAAAELRQRIDLVTHYGLFHPGQAFTDGLKQGARGPEMVVVPHGAFRMGAAPEEAEASDSERPAHYVRFDRGFAMSRTEVTVGDFRRFVAASGYRPTATRRGYSMVYEERNGNFVRRSGIDWRSTYDGDRAGDELPVLHVSARDADAYAEWLSAQSGQRYRLASEAEFEYALRAGSDTRFPWGGGGPPAGAGNFTGARDRSPSGRAWRNAFAGYGDGYWGPAPVGRFSANAYGLHDLAGNVGEWVADCWHDSYRRAPDEGVAWFNPGCRTRVMRGGAWASAPGQTRSAWRAPAGVETTNARIGFRVVREL